MSDRHPSANAARILESLDSRAILARLDDLAREERALRVLLKAARARERAPRHHEKQLANAAEIATV